VEVNLEVLQFFSKQDNLYDMSSSPYLPEVLQVPFVVLTRPVAWEVGRLLVLDDFGANMELLERLLALKV
jgi:hypothetical protein